MSVWEQSRDCDPLKANAWICIEAQVFFMVCVGTKCFLRQRGRRREALSACASPWIRGERCALINRASHGNYCFYLCKVKHSQSQRGVEVIVVVTNQSGFPSHFLVAIDFCVFCCWCVWVMFWSLWIHQWPQNLIQPDKLCILKEIKVVMPSLLNNLHN